MNTALAVPRVRGPGLGWVPEVLRRRATWRTVWRFLWAGPLLGGLPYVWMLISLPFAYLIGAVPAALAGGLFALWYHGPGGRVPTWPWRAAVGALAGVAATALVALGMLLLLPRVNWFLVGVVGVHGVPSALLLALMQGPGQGCANPR